MQSVISDASRAVIRGCSRDQITTSGETRSQLYQRLRAEAAWDIAEAEKELVRRRSRDAGMTKAASGQQAWDAIAVAFPPVDVVTWFEFSSRVTRPPLLSRVSDVTDETAAIAGAWSLSMTLAASLATRCPEIRKNCMSLILAIDKRLSLEPADALIMSETLITERLDIIAERPNAVVARTLQLFQAYQAAETSYSESVTDELRNFSQILELLPHLVDQQWANIRPWLFGLRSNEARRFLARACDKPAKMSSRIA
ncbi:MAG: hypothetical protein O3B13_14260 [Planctomycetota bacterium]|nr:hypothetical protein [Planctomycetota bacterium]